MATIEDNKRAWDGTYDWKTRGDEWSAAWGGPSMQWYGSILPRIRSHVPTRRILEIACGYGRWTQYLKDLCESLVVVDLSVECIRACEERFAGSSNVEYHVNDGKSLDMIRNASVDFVFSGDSLVHANESVMEAYVRQLERLLKDDGVAFIHHSNLGEYRARYSRVREIPKLEGLLARLGILNLHWRDFGVNARKVETWAEANGLRCISQELVPWGTRGLFIDCFSTIVKSGSSRARENRVLRNGSFMQEAQNLLRLSRLYTDQA